MRLPKELNSQVPGNQAEPSLEWAPKVHEYR